MPTQTFNRRPLVAAAVAIAGLGALSLGAFTQITTSQTGSEAVSTSVAQVAMAAPLSVSPRIASPGGGGDGGDGGWFGGGNGGAGGAGGADSGQANDNSSDGNNNGSGNDNGNGSANGNGTGNGNGNGNKQN